MKQRSTTPVSNFSLAARACVIAATILTLSVAPFTAPPAKADQYDDQIAAIQRQIDGYNAQAQQLQDQRKTLETELARLNVERAQIQGKLDLSVAQQKQLAAQIEETKAKIADNKQALGDTMADIYVDDGITPLEMLASSNNIADYVDKQSNRTQVQTTLQSTIKEIDRLKKLLEQQKKDIDRVVADQQYARDALVQKENEQANLIAQTKGQEDAFQALSSQGQQQQQQLKQQQQDAISAAMRRGGGGGSAVAGDPSRGGYPNNLASAPMDTLVDPWGMYNRECVSYTSWKVQQKTGAMPYWGGRGNANEWPGNARAAGIATSSVPRAGSVGVISAGAYGHVVWVESVNGDGTINISQYNEWLPNGGWGQYSERYNVNPRTYDTYIYF